MDAEAHLRAVLASIGDPSEYPTTAAMCDAYLWLESRGPA